ncbi:MAG: aminopeptidase [Dethiosulfovibrio peptidovorans]|nr:MAG: aminopeptidase [Dethiosulfovibrio peptidovorans]
MTGRIRDEGVIVGSLAPGSANLLTDVSGVTVGHLSLDAGDVKTGVTVVVPASGSLFREKLPAAVHVINGFGKSVGLVQIEELGTLETPIVLTNTLSVGDCFRGLVEVMLESDSAIGRETCTVNPVVMECNDGYLNDIRGLHVIPDHVRQALERADRSFALGGVGAGMGMSCYQLKGGIGSASRMVEIEAERYTVGVLVLSNFGELADLIVDGGKIGSAWASRNLPEPNREQGSIIVIIATDAPMTARQLKRLCKRASVGIARTGGYMAHGSGEISLAFSTAYRIPHDDRALLTMSFVSDHWANQFFRAVTESVEEAVLDSMWCAQTVLGRDEHIRESLPQIVKYMEWGFTK